MISIQKFAAESAVLAENTARASQRLGMLHATVPGRKLTSALTRASLVENMVEAL